MSFFIKIHKLSFISCELFFNDLYIFNTLGEKLNTCHFVFSLPIFNPAYPVSHISVTELQVTSCKMFFFVVETLGACECQYGRCYHGNYFYILPLISSYISSSAIVCIIGMWGSWGRGVIDLI